MFLLPTLTAYRLAILPLGYFASVRFQNKVIASTDVDGATPSTGAGSHHHHHHHHKRKHDEEAPAKDQHRPSVKRAVGNADGHSDNSRDR